MNHYSYHLFWSDEDDCYIVTSTEFPRLSAFGDTAQEALKEFEIALSGTIEVYEAEGWPLPQPLTSKIFATMGEMLTGLPPGAIEMTEPDDADDD